MRKIDKELYQYILDHSSLITENWLNMRKSRMDPSTRLMQPERLNNN